MSKFPDYSINQVKVDTVTILDYTRNRIPFSHSPKWLEDAVDDGKLRLDDSNCKLYLDDEVIPTGARLKFNKEKNEITVYTWE